MTRRARRAFGSRSIIQIASCATSSMRKARSISMRRKCSPCRRRAVLWPGDNPRVYVDQGNGAYQQRRVILGRPGDDFWEVLEGVKEGERVVASGNMLIDSQAQLQNVSAPSDESPPLHDPALEMTRGAARRDGEIYHGSRRAYRHAGARRSRRIQRRESEASASAGRLAAIFRSAGGRSRIGAARVPSIQRSCCELRDARPRTFPEAARLSLSDERTRSAKACRKTRNGFSFRTNFTIRSSGEKCSNAAWR